MGMPMGMTRPLSPHDAGAYVELRREMLTDSPWAFASSPGSDRMSDPGAVASRLCEPYFAIAGGFAANDEPGAGPGDGPSIGAAASDASARLVASAGVYRDTHPKLAHRAHIWGVYVSPGSRGLALGRGVMLEAIGIARRWEGVGAICLSVSARSILAMGLYESLGFVCWGVEPDVVRINGESADEHHMRLAL